MKMDKNTSTLEARACAFVHYLTKKPPLAPEKEQGQCGPCKGHDGGGLIQLEVGLMEGPHERNASSMLRSPPWPRLLTSAALLILPCSSTSGACGEAMQPQTLVPTSLKSAIAKHSTFHKQSNRPPCHMKLCHACTTGWTACACLSFLYSTCIPAGPNPATPGG